MASLDQWLQDMRDLIAKLDLCQALGLDVTESKDHLRKVLAETIVNARLAEDIFGVDAPTVVAFAKENESAHA